LLRPYLENSLRPLYEPIQYTQVTQRRVLIGVVHATWRQRLDGSTRRVTAGGNTGKALGSGNTGQLRRPHGVKATHRRVLIGVVHATRRIYAYTYGGGLGGNTGQSDEDSTVRDTGQLIGRGDTSLVSRRGGSRSPGAGPTSTAPSCKTRSACHEETLTGNAKRELVVYRV